MKKKTVASMMTALLAAQCIVSAVAGASPATNSTLTGWANTDKATGKVAAADRRVSGNYRSAGEGAAGEGAVPSPSENPGHTPNLAARSTQPDPGSDWNPGSRLPKRVATGFMEGIGCDGRDLLYHGHVDATYVTREKGKLVIKVVDGSAVRDLSEVCLRLPVDGAAAKFGEIEKGDEISRLTVPDDPKWRFLGNPGALIWYAPQIDLNGAPIWAGLGAFDPVHEKRQPVGVKDRLVTLRLVKVETPNGEDALTPKNHHGEQQLNIFTINGNQPGSKMFSTNLGIWEYKMSVGGHSHANWTFSAPGMWKLFWQAEMTVNGKVEKTPVTEQTWLVGSNRDVLLSENSTPDTNKIIRTAEELRSAKKLSAPKENGFDYQIDDYQPVYQPGECGNLTPPQKPVPAEHKPILTEPWLPVIKKLWWEPTTQEFSGQQYRVMFWPDFNAHAVRNRIFNEKATSSEIQQVLAPLDPVNEGKEPATPNSYRSGEAKYLPVTDNALTAYGPNTFRNTGSYREHIKNNQLYTLGLGNQRSAQFTLEIPKDLTGRVKAATIYLSGLDSRQVEVPEVAVGKLGLNKLGQLDSWQHLLSSTDADQRKITLKPGEQIPVQLLFSGAGLQTLEFNVHFDYQKTGENDYLDDADTSYRVVIGNEMLNAFQDWKQKQDVSRETTVNNPSPLPAAKIAGNEIALSPGYYGEYNQQVAQYNAKVKACTAGTSVGSDQDKQDNSGKGGKQIADQGSTTGSGVDNQSGVLSGKNPSGGIKKAKNTRGSTAGGDAAAAPDTVAPDTATPDTVAPDTATSAPVPAEASPLAPTAAAPTAAAPADEPTAPADTPAAITGKTAQSSLLSNKVLSGNPWWHFLSWEYLQDKLPFTLAVLGALAAVSGLGLFIYALVISYKRRKTFEKLGLSD